MTTRGKHVVKRTADGTAPKTVTMSSARSGTAMLSESRPVRPPTPAPTAPWASIYERLSA